MLPQIFAVFTVVELDNDHTSVRPRPAFCCTSRVIIQISKYIIHVHMYVYIHIELYVHPSCAIYYALSLSHHYGTANVSNYLGLLPQVIALDSVFKL